MFDDTAKPKRKTARQEWLSLCNCKGFSESSQHLISGPEPIQGSDSGCPREEHALECVGSAIRTEGEEHEEQVGSPFFWGVEVKDSFALPL